MRYDRENSGKTLILKETIMKTALVMAAPGCEETETLGTVDVLRRGGVSVTVASMMPGLSLDVAGAHGITFKADAHFDDVKGKEFDAVVCPGGMGGASTMRDSQEFVSYLRKQKAEGRWIAAICASPALVLTTNRIAPEAKMTGYPGCGDLDHPVDADAYTDSSEKVITGRGPGLTFKFALQIVSALQGEAKAREVADGLLLSL